MTGTAIVCIVHTTFYTSAAAIGAASCAECRWSGAGADSSAAPSPQEGPSLRAGSAAQHEPEGVVQCYTTGLLQEVPNEASRADPNANGLAA